MTVLTEQHIERRRHNGRRSRAAVDARVTRESSQRREIRRSARRGRRGFSALALLLAASALAAAIVLAVPRLEAYSRSVVDPDAVEIASADGLLGLFALRPAGTQDVTRTRGDLEAEATDAEPLVDFELTDDLEYIVGEGETLSEIALRYDVDYQVLARFNRIADPDSIRAGTRIVIPGTLTRGLGIPGETGFR
jgi:hypothetical protein